MASPVFVFHPVNNGILGDLLEFIKLCQQGRLLSLSQGLCGKLLKRGGQGVGVPGLEEHQPFRGCFRGVLFEGEVHAVFPGYTVKALDVLVGDLNIGNTRTLLNKLLDTLFAVGSQPLVMLFSHLRQ